MIGNDIKYPNCGIADAAGAEYFCNIGKNVYMRSRILIVLMALCSFAAAAQQTAADGVVSIAFTDSAEHEPLGFAACVLHNGATSRDYGAAASSDGICRWTKLPAGTYTVKVMYMGRVFVLPEICLTGHEQHFHLSVEIDPTQIEEVVVTASESKGLATSSAIGQEAMQHIQPSSIADIMALLPGGRSIDPSLATPQTIRLREAGDLSGSEYTTSALGTAFIVDGVPIGTDANMQSSRVSTSLNTSSNYGFLNRGVDTRSISTDDIESVEVVRGIASVEYGDLTSGMIQIKRKQGGRNLEARFKADMSSKLLYVGKGFEWGEKGDRLTMNVGVNWLDSQSDPRNARQNYKRATAMYRINKEWTSRTPYSFSLGGNIDYTGSFDRQKSDTDLDNGTGGAIETYRSDYNRAAFSANFSMRAKETRFLRSVTATASVAAEFDRIEQWRFVALGSVRPVSSAYEEGEYDVESLPAEYEALLTVDGKPFYAFAKTMAVMGVDTEHSANSIKAGVEWRMDKNYGKGYIFDVTRPISPDMNLRPRAYDVIPAKHSVSAFVEGESRFSLGTFDFDIMAGVRSTTVANLGREYSLNGRTYFDPRINLKITPPRAMIGGNPMVFSVTGGAGWHTKLPTMSQLFPDPIYYDVTQMNYWPTDPSLRRLNVKVFRYDPTNYDLAAARNFKWEVRADAAWNGYSLSVTWFREDMTSGFRPSSSYTRYIYKDYDEQAVDHSTLTAPPSLETTPYVLDTLLVSHSTWNNGSRTLKKGVEFVFSTKRIRALRTKLTVTGAYFRTEYTNSAPEYYRPSVVVSGKIYPYVGYYEDGTSCYLRDMFNTNFLLDTQIPRLGLIFSTSFECVWYTGRKTLPYSVYPIYYIDKNLEQHPFTEESLSSGVLSEMVRTGNETTFRFYRVPFLMNINLKVTKKLYHDKISASMFVNRIINYTPSYYSYGTLIRRDTSPYFGMELNFKL